MGAKHVRPTSNQCGSKVEMGSKSVSFAPFCALFPHQETIPTPSSLSTYTQKPSPKPRKLLFKRPPLPRHRPSPDWTSNPTAGISSETPYPRGAFTHSDSKPMPPPAPRAGRWTYAALFLVALATLMYEVLLTRIFSVTMYYHFAFVAVSVALFGMTLGAVIVYLFPKVFAPGSPQTQRQMALASLVFGVTVLVTFIAHLA